MVQVSDERLPKRSQKKDHPSREVVSDVHGQFFPADVRGGERVECWIQLDGSAREHRCRVWRLSPFGLEIVEDGTLPLCRGTSISVQLQIANQNIKYRGCVVARFTGEGERKIVGIRLDTSPKAGRGAGEIDQRKGAIRWQCHRLFYPTGTANNTARFNDKVYFRVSDVSSSGMRLVTSLRNKHLVVGANLELQVQVPSVGDFTVKVEIIYVSVVEEGNIEFQAFGVKFVNPTRKCLSHLGQYVLQFGGDESHNPTPKTLAKQGFFLHSIADALDYDIVRTDEEYRQVLELRSSAFRAVKGFGVQLSPTEMADIYDAKSRILICRYRDKIVATTRLLFVGDEERFEEEQYISLPSSFPPRRLVVGASRAAVHPDFRGSDLFLNIFRYVMLQTLQSGRRYILQSVTEELISVYERVGFRQMKITYNHPKFPGKIGHLLLGDCEDVLNGKVGSMVTWHTLVPDIKDLLQENDSVNLTWLAKGRLSVYNLLTPVYRVFERRRISRRMRRRITESLD